MKIRRADTESFGAQASLESPWERFIIEKIQPRRREMNSWGQLKSHTKLLVDAARGQKLRPQKIGSTHTSTFTLTRSGTQVGGVSDGVSTLVSHQALRAAQSRETARLHLRLSEVPHLAARTFHISQGNAAAAFMQTVDQPVSVRPSSPLSRWGATANLTTVNELAQAWERAAEACAGLSSARQQIEVEPFLPWIPLRIFVVGESVVAAMARVPLYVTGDGEQTLGALAEEELESRLACSFLDRVNISGHAELLALRGLDAESVLGEGKIELLTYDRGGQLGLGWSFEFPGQLPQDLGELAVSAVWAFPGLGASAVDILTPSVSDGTGAVVCGVEPAADLREFRYPAFGNSQLPHRSIMERISA